jgi:polyisoprenoid-binding protein YceI
VKTDVPGTTCSLDKAHASLIFRVSHLAFSNWMGRFASFDANLMLDSKNPANSHVEATIDPNSLASDNPPPGFRYGSLRFGPSLGARADQARP